MTLKEELIRERVIDARSTLESSTLTLPVMNGTMSEMEWIIRLNRSKLEAIRLLREAHAEGHVPGTVSVFDPALGKDIQPDYEVVKTFIDFRNKYSKEWNAQTELFDPPSDPEKRRAYIEHQLAFEERRTRDTVIILELHGQKIP